MKSIIKLLFLLLAIIGATNIVNSQSSVASDEPISEWYKQYQPIDNPKAFAFLQQGLSYAKELYGEPRIPAKTVILRLSFPLNPNRNIKKGFRLTELANAKKGMFIIYLSSRPDEYAFYGQLAHEIPHLLNAQLYDCYVEGLNTVFAEKLLRRSGLDWSGWEDYFKEAEDPISAFYAASYFMMKDVSQVAGESGMKSFLAYARFNSENPSRMHIDINEWLNSLPSQKRMEVRKVILKHASLVQKTMGEMNDHFVFLIPK